MKAQAEGKVWLNSSGWLRLWNAALVSMYPADLK